MVKDTLGVPPIICGNYRQNIIFLKLRSGGVWRIRMIIKVIMISQNKKVIVGGNSRIIIYKHDL